MSDSAKAAREQLLLKRIEELDGATSTDPDKESVRLATLESLLDEYARLVDDAAYVPSELVKPGEAEASFAAQLQKSAPGSVRVPSSNAPKSTANGLELPSYEEALDDVDDSIANVLKQEQLRAAQKARIELEDRLFAEQLQKDFEAESMRPGQPRADAMSEADRMLAERLSREFNPPNASHLEEDRKLAELLFKEEKRLASSEAEDRRLAILLAQEGELLKQAIDFRKANGLAPDPEEDRKYAEFLSRQETMDAQFRAEAEAEAKRQVEIAAAKRRVAELTHKERSVRFTPQTKSEPPVPKPVRDAPDIIACESLDDLMPPEVDVSNLSQGFVRVPQRFLNVVVGPSHKTLKAIEKATSTIIRAPTRATMPNQTHTTFFVFGTPAQIAAAKAKMTAIMESKDNDGILGQETSSVINYLHVFIDYSNVLIGCRTFGSENNVPNKSLQLDLGRLIEIIEHGRPTKTRGIAGSNISESEVEAAVKVGYNAWVSSRPWGTKEQFVDEKLHAQILIVVANKKEYPPPQTLIIVTGDGNDNGDDVNSSFPKCAEVALSNDWVVEVWSWKHCLSRRYIDLQVRFPDYLKVFYLDDYAMELIVPDFN